MTNDLDQVKELKRQMLDLLQLERDPFVDREGDFYMGAQQQHYLETLRHLATFGDVVLFLLGERGAGKTSLLKAFVSEFGGEVNVLFLAAGGEFVGKPLLPRLAKLVGVEVHENEPAEEVLVHCIQALQHVRGPSQQRTLLIIDDADQLLPKERQALLAVFRQMPDEAPVVLLMSGLPSLQSDAKSAKQHAKADWFHMIPLRPFSREEAQAYLQHRLERAGYSQELMLSDQQAAILAEGGKGLPGRINRVFPAVMLGAKVFESEARRTSTLDTSKVVAGIALLLVCSFLFVAYQHGLFSGHDNDAKGGFVAAEGAVNEVEAKEAEIERERLDRLARIERAIAAQHDTPSESEEIPSLDSEEAQASADPVSIETGPVEAVAEQEQVADAVAFTQEDATLDEASEEPDVPASGFEENTEFAKAEQPAESPNVEGASIPARPSSSDQAAGSSMALADSREPLSEEPGILRSKEWVMRQPPGSYTIQVLGSYQRETALKFIARGESRGVQMYYLETRYKGKPWYVVLLGEYSSKAAARSGLAAAPDWLKKQKPWLRSFEGILASYPD
ncbi:MAG: AAA family ATPase [Oleiphilaceae bacterium]|nr:AAA family ATPase [Oleiphilaceae bacterium]